ncbi:GNVR domain-containing protein [Methylobacterium sp. 092160098-2]|uniref:GumC family protein n=1 Tax=Methylobacterium sp. 092160098-2 TaxID=3025129 RepID=UPI002381C550|nr:GNVR domain-containing protein [Methylobacterium sp. 092160098-2]MDE4912174.1 GNVR domain-containing protein [Methylobacterium sp. 092160098-2]
MLHDQDMKPSIGTVLRCMWKHKALMVLAVGAGIALFLSAYLLIAPVYEASTSLLVSQASENISDGSRKQLELITSQARIAESEDVVRGAINRVGLDKFKGVGQSRLPGLGGWLRQIVHGRRDTEGVVPENAGGKDSGISDIDLVASVLSRRLTVRTEPNSEVLKISFQYTDPRLTAAFVNAVAESFIERQIRLADTPGAIDFFREQKKRFNEEVEMRSRLLEHFSRRERMYSVEDERSLLLHRASDIAAALTATRSSLVDKQGQKGALVAQLRLLKPVTQSPFVSNLVENLGGDEKGRSPSRGPSENTAGAGDPPLLMVRVYQDSMVALLKVNSEIAGLLDLVKQQEQEISTVNRDLTTLVSKQTEFERLKRDVAQATLNAELYAKRTTEEQINADLRSAKLTNIRVIQSATTPLRAVFPNGAQFLGLGVVFGLILGASASLMLEMYGSRPVSDATAPDAPAAPGRFAAAHASTPGAQANELLRKASAYFAMADLKRRARTQSES